MNKIKKGEQYKESVKQKLILWEQFQTSFGKTKQNRIPKTILSNKRTTECITFPVFKFCYRDMALQTTWY